MLCRATEETSVLTGKTEILWTAVKAAELVSAGLAAATLTMHGREKENWERERERDGEGYGWTVLKWATETADIQSNVTQITLTTDRPATIWLLSHSPLESWGHGWVLYTHRHETINGCTTSTMKPSPEITVSHYHLASNYCIYFVSRRRHVYLYLVAFPKHYK